MPKFKVAHLHEQGQDMLLFPLDGGSIHHKTNSEKADVLAELEFHAHEAGLAGTAALVWDHWWKNLHVWTQSMAGIPAKYQHTLDYDAGQ